MSKRSKEREAYLAGLSAFDPDNDLAPTADERGAYLATGVSPAPKVKPAQPSRRRTDYWKTVTGLMTEPEFRALGAVERCLLFELVARKDRIDRLHCKKGHTPDDIIGCSVREAANLLGLGKLHAGRAMAKLVERGFIAKAREPSKGPRRRGTSTGWRLTFLPFQGEAPTRDYVKIAARKERQSYADRVAGVPFFEPPDDDEVSHLWDRGVPPMGHLGVPRVGQVSNTDILIFSPTKSTDYEVGVPPVGHLRGKANFPCLAMPVSGRPSGLRSIRQKETWRWQAQRPMTRRLRTFALTGRSNRSLGLLGSLLLCPALVGNRMGRLGLA